jgi:hypothetical protein
MLGVEQVDGGFQSLDLAPAAVKSRQMKLDFSHQEQRVFAVRDRNRRETYTFAAQLIHAFLFIRPVIERAPNALANVDGRNKAGSLLSLQLSPTFPPTPDRIDRPDASG